MKQTSLFWNGDTRVREVAINPGEAGAWHRHGAVTDHVCVLRGALRLDRDGEPPLRLGEGDSARVGPGVVHRLVNDGTAPTTYLLIQVGGAYDFIRAEPGQPG